MSAHWLHPPPKGAIHPTGPRVATAVARASMSTVTTAVAVCAPAPFARLTGTTPLIRAPSFLGARPCLEQRTYMLTRADNGGESVTHVVHCRQMSGRYAFHCRSPSAHLPLRQLVLVPLDCLAAAATWPSGVARRNPIPSHPSVGPTRPRPDERALRASAEIPASQHRGPLPAGRCLSGGMAGH